MNTTALPARFDLTQFDPLTDKSYQLTRLGVPLADYLASKRVSGRADKTLRDKESYVGAFATMWPALELHAVEPRHVVHYLSECAKAGLARESIRVRRSHLNDFFEWAVRWGLTDRNPLDRIEQASRAGTKKVYDIFADAEVAALCNLPVLDGALMRVMFDAGLRRSECAKLRPRDVLPEPPPGQLAILDAKGGKNRLVPVTGALGRSLALLRMETGMSDTEFFWYVRRNQARTVQRVRPIGDGSFQRWWDRCIQDAGIAAAISRDFFAPGMDRADFEQEARLAAWQAERSWRPGGESLDAWTRRCVKARLATVVKTALRQKRTAVLVPLEDWNHPACEDGGAWPVVDALRRLPAHEQRTLLGLAAGYSYEELAAREGVSVKAIDGRLFEARAALKRWAA